MTPLNYLLPLWANIISMDLTQNILDNINTDPNPFSKGLKFTGMILLSTLAIVTISVSIIIEALSFFIYLSGNFGYNWFKKNFTETHNNNVANQLFRWCAKKNFSMGLKFLLNHTNIIPDSCDNNGFSALDYASKHDSARCAKIILNIQTKNRYINQISQDAVNKALWYCADANNITVMKILLDKGAETESRWNYSHTSESYTTPYMCAYQKNNCEALKLLGQYAADISSLRALTNMDLNSHSERDNIVENHKQLYLELYHKTPDTNLSQEAQTLEKNILDLYGHQLRSYESYTKKMRCLSFLDNSNLQDMGGSCFEVLATLDYCITHISLGIEKAANNAVVQISQLLQKLEDSPKILFSATPENSHFRGKLLQKVSQQTVS